MQNILNHNRLQFNTTLNLSEYWDFHLYLKQSSGEGISDCIAAYIDTTKDECIIDGGLKSIATYSECKNNNLEFKNIGFTGMDNGLIRFNKYKTTPEEFVKLLTDSVYKADDCNLRLYKVDGNNNIYNYSSVITTEDDVRCVKLNGGYFQGFFMDSECKYKVLPNKIDNNGWSLEFELKPYNFRNTERTLNDIHPENKGIFFYMGTRAENKWIKYYQDECEEEKSALEKPYYPVDYVEVPDCEIDECLKDDYYPESYIADSDCDCKPYFKEEYLEKKPDPEEKVTADKTNDGHLLNEANLTEIKTENKFVLFDRSCKGVTVKTYEEGDTAVIQYRTIPDDKNYFTLFNRSCDGITVKDYSEYLETNGNKYNINADLYKNSFALQVKDDGSVGYKYFLKDCDNPKCGYKIESEFSHPNVVKYNEWSNVHVRFLAKPDSMHLMFYVNGILKLVSKELPKFDFRKLNDTPDKQEGVPFNISLGGGTQGLCDVIYNNYMDIPEYVYPLEKEFGGTFIGYMKSFKFYECAQNFNQIRINIYN